MNMENIIKFTLIIILICATFPSASENMVIVIIDGARYSETFGDSDHTYIPGMWELSKEGAVLTNFNNDSATYTSKAVPALWCGSWTETRDTVYKGNSTQYSVKPSIFECYRKGLDGSTLDCYYVLKYIRNLWLPSFDKNYGPQYWPNYHSEGDTDNDVAVEALQIIEWFTPPFLWVYLADVDGGGHSGNWNTYTTALKNADSIVCAIWEKLQSNDKYKDKTTMIVTNDHGRHDDDHGGFRGHGDGCEGCRHIMFMAIGPGIKSGYSSDKYRRIPDMAVTAAAIQGFEMPDATGDVITEIFKPLAMDHDAQIPQGLQLKNYPNPFNPVTTIRYSVGCKDAMHRVFTMELSVYNSIGQKLETLVNTPQQPGEYRIKWNAKSQPAGIYFLKLNTSTSSKFNPVITRKIILLN